MCGKQDEATITFEDFNRLLKDGGRKMIISDSHQS